MTGALSAQLEIERDAIALLGRPVVGAAVSRLAQRWRAGTPGFSPETYAQLPSSIGEVAFLVALQVVGGDPDRPQIVEISAGPHAWGGLSVPGGRWGINNPDTLYFAAPIRTGSHYLLRGRLRGRPPTDLNVSVQAADVWATLDSLGRRDIAFDPDGSFSITLGAESSGDHPNRLPIRDGGTVALIRQTLGDWTTELPYDLSIERLPASDSVPPGPRPRSVHDQERRLVERLEVVIEHSLQTLQPPIFGLDANTIPPPGTPGNRPGYLIAQRQTLGHFRLGEDEALIIELSPGDAGYVAVAATNVWGISADADRHQNSLNNRQADLGADGRITVVLANTDPGVANWIDPGGLPEGIVMARWQLLATGRSTGRGPDLRARLVRAADLPIELPASSHRRVSAAERERQLEARAAGYARRFADR